jgi:hypothetical protein
MTVEEDLVQRAEREVIDAAVEWSREQQRQPPTVQSAAASRLRTACYMLHRARTITGKVRMEDVERAMAEDEEKKRR